MALAAFSVEDTIYALYCSIDDALAYVGIVAKDGKLVDRPGPPPELDDREVLSLAVLQEVLGFESDHAYFLWLENQPVIRELFPKLIKRPKFAERRALLTDLALKLNQAFCALQGEGQPPFSSSTRIPSRSATCAASATNVVSMASHRLATAPRSRNIFTACANT
jgi:hypothetical protein